MVFSLGTCEGLTTKSLEKVLKKFKRNLSRSKFDIGVDGIWEAPARNEFFEDTHILILLKN